MTRNLIITVAAAAALIASAIAPTLASPRNRPPPGSGGGLSHIVVCTQCLNNLRRINLKTTNPSFPVSGFGGGVGGSSGKIKQAHH